MIKNKNTEAESNKVTTSRKLTNYEKKYLHKLVMEEIANLKNDKEKLKENKGVQSLLDDRIKELTEIKRKLE